MTRTNPKDYISGNKDIFSCRKSLILANEIRCQHAREGYCDYNDDVNVDVSLRWGCHPILRKNYT